jgi:hypothetical protein
MSGMIDFTKVQQQLEEFWDLPDGYFYLLRQGYYDPKGANAVEALLLSIGIEEEMALPRRFVSLTWWIPTFMEWQIERVGQQGGDTEALGRDIVRLRNALDKVLGVP